MKSKQAMIATVNVQPKTKPSLAHRTKQYLGAAKKKS